MMRIPVTAAYLPPRETALSDVLADVVIAYRLLAQVGDVSTTAPTGGPGDAESGGSV